MTDANPFRINKMPRAARGSKVGWVPVSGRVPLELAEAISKIITRDNVILGDFVHRALEAEVARDMADAA